MKTLELIPFKSNAASYLDKKTKLVRLGKNTEYGTVRVKSGAEGFVALKGAIVRQQSRQASITLPLEIIEGAKVGDDLNAILIANDLDPMTIVYEESFAPFYEGQEPAQDKDGNVREIDGRNYYLQAFVVIDDADAKDVRLTRAAVAAKVAVGTTTES